jgi:hypothetical protein
MTLGNSPQPLTRRQLRELARENEPASVDPAGTPDAPVPSADSPSADSPTPHHSRHISAPAETPAEKPAEKSADLKPTSVKPAAVKPAAVKPSAVKPTAVKPAATRAAPAPLPIPGAAPAANAVVIDSVVVDPGPTLTRRELRALQAAAAASAAPADAAPAALDQPTAGVAASESSAPAAGTPAAAGFNPPVGHWSVDPDDDDSHIQTIGRRDDQTFDDLVGRGVGAGGIPTTTNALILPAIPRQGPSGPITSTGEIMITGSIDLPRSLGATGQHPNLFDSSEMDRMLDQLDEGGHHNDVAPVSASRAVSTHTSTRGVMTPPRKRGASLPTVLAITAAVLAIGVLSLFVVGYAFNIY